MSFRLGRILIRIHFLLPILGMIGFLFHMEDQIVPNLSAFVLHEAGHMLSAKLWGAAIREIEITPLGGVMFVEGEEKCLPYQQFLIAFAGPFFSFLGCVLSAALYHSGAVSFQFAAHFARMSFLLCLFNLIPVLPLDGGRMARILLCRFFPHSFATRILTAAAFLIGFFLCGVTFFFAFEGRILLAPVFAGLYLIYAANIEGKQNTAGYITALIGRRQRLDNNEIILLEAVAASANMPVLSLLRSFSPGKYHVVYVLSPDGMEKQGILEEKALCDAILNQKDATLGEIIEKSRAFHK